MKNKTWRIEVQGGGQIADTGDYSDPYYVLTNGDIELVTKDDLDDFKEDDSYNLVIVEALNQLGAKWEDWKLSEKEFELHLQEEISKQWKTTATELYNSLLQIRKEIFKFTEMDKIEIVDRAMSVYQTSIENLP